VTEQIKIEVLPGTGIAEEKDVARLLREDTIKPALRAAEDIEIDFANAEIVTQSFIHALLAEPICRFGDKALDLIVFKNCSEQVRQIIRTVIEYTFMAIEEGGAADQPPKRGKLVINTEREERARGNEGNE
jgi:STAS-like domain of unknown function (DUF4325)